MPRPYSADLRERALRACARAEASRAEIARRFEVAEATLYGWLKQAREEGRREAKPHAGGPAPTIDAAGLAWRWSAPWSARTAAPRSRSTSSATPRVPSSGSAWR
jgi:transposase-like protein